MRERCLLLSCLAISVCATETTAEGRFAADDWPYYRGDPAGTHYSTLEDISNTNVHKLAVAWTYDTGEDVAGTNADMQSNPLVVAGQLFFVSPKGRLISLDAASGRQRWAFDPAAGVVINTRQRLRGVSYWSEGKQRRIFFTFQHHLFAIDADSGVPVRGFGRDGRIDLRVGLGRDPSGITVANTSPGVVFEDLIIIGSTTFDAPGHIRAFDVRTGAMRWIFHTIPHPGEFGHETWPKDAWKTAKKVNNWAGMTLDVQRALVFVPLATADIANNIQLLGAGREGDNLFGNSLVALDARTGRRVWHFQTAHHDLWDRDLPAPPTLVTVRRNGKDIDAVAQITKSGFVFVFDRETGKPLFPIEERPVPASDVPGEVTARTQPFPVLPVPFARQHLTEALLTRRTAEAHEAVKKEFRTLRSRGPFDPPSLQGTIVFPGQDGGGQWGGAAFDPESRVLYVNSNEMAWIIRLRKAPPVQLRQTGRSVYLHHCAACHRDDRSGHPPEFPSLIGVGDRLGETGLTRMIRDGGGRMPGFRDLEADQIRALVEYVRTGESREISRVAATLSSSLPFVLDSVPRFLDPDGYPAVSPPWGTLNALDLDSGRYRWTLPFGEYPELAARGMRNTGSENYGGAVVTRGGLLFIGATVYDNKFRAYDKFTGALLWQTTLPAAGNATPATYRAGARQFVVICAGGGKNPNAQPGTQVIAFALPE